MVDKVDNFVCVAQDPDFFLSLRVKMSRDWRDDLSD